MVSSSSGDSHVAQSSEKPKTSLSSSTEYPGQTMGIVSLVLLVVAPIPALILAIVAWVWSSKAGISNLPAKVAVAVSAALIILGLLALIGWGILVFSALNEIGFEGFDDSGFSSLSS